MSNISKLRLENFKGFSDLIQFELKPLTFFYGANSSGKSSVIHALAALSQTLRLTNNKRALILDDERALISLGRFIEIIHSHSYGDTIHLGFEIPNVNVIEPGAKDAKFKTATLKADYHFGCVKKTQEIIIKKAIISLDDLVMSIEESADGYRLHITPHNITAKIDFEKGFLVAESSLFSKLFVGNKPNLKEADATLRHKIFFWFITANQALAAHITAILYLGPFRNPPVRKYDTFASSPTEVGARGESTVTLLANETIQKSKKTHIEQLGRWLALMGLGEKIALERIGKSDSFGLDITLTDQKSLPIADLGFGLSQVMPVLTQCSFAPKNSVLLFEQPELHVHPKAQGPLTEIFAQTINEKECQILAETHSPELIRSAFRLLRAKKLKLDQLAIYKIERQDKASRATKLDIYQNGDDFDVGTNWEKDFCA